MSGAAMLPAMRYADAYTSRYRHLLRQRDAATPLTLLQRRRPLSLRRLRYLIIFFITPRYGERP